MSRTSVIDSHLHLVSYDRDAFPRQEASAGDFLPGTPHVENWWLDRGFDAPSMVGELDLSGVERAVAVQPHSLYAFDNRYLLDAACGPTGRFAGVAAVDVTAHDVAVTIESLAPAPGLVGIRVMAKNTGSAWASESGLRTAVEVAGRCGLAVIVSCRAEHLAGIVAVVEELDPWPVLIDHAAHPAFADDGRIGPGSPLNALASLGHVSVKVTNLVFRRAGDQRRGARALADVVSVFGSDRVLWGSDYPHTRAGDYAESVRLARDVSAPLGTEAQSAYLYGNAQRVLGHRGRAGLDGAPAGN